MALIPGPTWANETENPLLRYVRENTQRRPEQVIQEMYNFWDAPNPEGIPPEPRATLRTQDSVYNFVDALGILHQEISKLRSRIENLEKLNESGLRFVQKQKPQ